MLDVHCTLALTYVEMGDKNDTVNLSPSPFSCTQTTGHTHKIQHSGGDNDGL